MHSVHTCSDMKTPPYGLRHVHELTGTTQVSFTFPLDYLRSLYRDGDNDVQQLV